MNSPAVYLEVDGKPVPATECVWIQSGRCGCDCSWVTAQVGDEVSASEADLGRNHSYSKAVVKRDIENGLTWRLSTFAALRLTDRTQKCQHTPQYGIPHVKIPGYGWRTTDGNHGRRGFRKHLIPLLPVVITGRAALNVPGKVAALCGKDDYPFVWNDWTHDCVTCRACEAEARKTIKEPDPGLTDLILEPTP